MLWGSGVGQMSAAITDKACVQLLDEWEHFTDGIGAAFQPQGASEGQLTRRCKLPYVNLPASLILTESKQERNPVLLSINPPTPTPSPLPSRPQQRYV